ncbi:hypothetical protein [Spirillospora sp. NPDC048819]|uniref:hypothetical protein n=1 Tax=Spirillospora sp. NPDC048819 TaxID=3155268 RepID=UPI0034007BCA
MTALANEHLTDLQHQLHTKRLARDLRSRTTPPELARLTRVLARYHDQIADGFGVPHPASADVRDGARRAGALIRQAEHLLGPPADTETPKSALAQKLRATSIALGCGLDLLSTHFPAAPDEATSADAVVIAAPDTARSLLLQLSTHTATIGHLSRHTTPPSDQAGTLLLKAAVLARIYSENQAPLPITAIPIRHTPPRIPPVISENDTQALAGIDASIRRLSNPSSLTSVTTWRYLARAAAITCDLNVKTIQQLIYRMKEIDEPDHRSALQEAATATKRMKKKWKEIVRRWDEQTNHHGYPANGPATDAGDLIIRLGRLIHADPAWTPTPRASYRMKPPEEIAPTLTQAARIATVALKTIEVCNTLAANHRAAINDAAVLGILHKQREHPTHMPRVPASARQLSKSYDAAEAVGRQAITTLGQATQALTPDPQAHPDDVRLIICRAVTNEQTQASLAADEFPTSATNRVEDPHSSTLRHSPAPTSISLTRKPFMR